LEREGEEHRGSRRIYKIFTVVEKPGNQKGIWLDIGIGSTNRDGSISGKLDCLPISGSIQLREHDQRDNRRNEGFRRNGEGPSKA